MAAPFTGSNVARAALSPVAFAPYESCNPQPPTVGGPALVGQNLTDIRARHWRQVGPGEAYAYRDDLPSGGLGMFSDESDLAPSHNYALGRFFPGVRPPAPPPGPFGPVNLTINGMWVASLTTNATNGWQLLVDFSLLTPINDWFTINATYRQAGHDIQVIRPYARPGTSPPGTLERPVPPTEGPRGRHEGARPRAPSPYAEAPGFGGCAGPDSDRDGIPDACDPDVDGDGIPNWADNCPHRANPGQVDADGSGLGDACDVDADGDGWADSVDLCPALPNAIQHDQDHDGLGDACDGDRDGDGVANALDAFPDDPRHAFDMDGDGTSDAWDMAVDGDGVPDAIAALMGADPGDASSRPAGAPQRPLQVLPASDAPHLLALHVALGFAIVLILLVPLARRP